MSAATNPILTSDLAGRFAQLALANIAREYPTKLDHIINGPSDLGAPRELHPLFWGSFDWHSCVHAHWMLARLLHRFPDAAFADTIRRSFDARFTAANVAGEIAYLRQPNRSSFVRTYGWAWLLKLVEALAIGSRGVIDAREFSRWRDTLAPLATEFVALYASDLPRAQIPLRYGMHPNSAFGLAFAIDYASTYGDSRLRELCCDKALDWFAADTDYPARFEPSGSDFLSPALIEADLMRRVLDRHGFAAWLKRFLPELGKRRPPALFTPAESRDPGDPQMVHLDGLNLSRAWCLRGMADALGTDDPRNPILNQAADEHLRAGLPTVQSGDYMGEHWLATFAVYALTETPTPAPTPASGGGDA